MKEQGHFHKNTICWKPFSDVQYFEQRAKLHDESCNIGDLGYD